MLSKMSDPKAAAFRRQFASENALQQVIAGLLTRMPDISSVQILQGTQEYGKDIIFSIRGAFGESILCAAVVKNTKITGNVGSSKGARTVFLQCEQAFDTPHLDVRAREIRIERVYVVTPFDLAPETVRAISGKLKQGTGQIQFIAGAQLFDLFKTYWPAVLADEFAAVASYLSSATSELAEEGALARLVFQYQLGGVDKGLRGVYVPPILLRELRSYKVSSTLSDPIPSDAALLAHLTKGQLDELHVRLRRGCAAFESLHEWGYVDAQESEHLIRGMDQLGSRLNEQWSIASARVFQKMLEKTLDDRRPTDKPLMTDSDRLPALEKVRNRTADEQARRAAERRIQRGIQLPGRRDLVQHVTTLRVDVKTTLTRLSAKLKNIEEFVSAGSHTAADVFSSAFLECSKTDEFVRQAPAGAFVSSDHRSQIACSSDLLADWGRSVLILAPAGYGKTSFCRWHALNDAEQFSTGKSTILPVYVALHKVAPDALTSFRELAKKTVGRSALMGVQEQPVNLDQQRIRIYLDGLDEIPGTEHRGEFLRRAGAASEEEPNVQLVITSREYVYDRDALSLPMLRLTELDDLQTQRLIAGWLCDRPTEAQVFHAELENSASLKPLMRIPLLATLVMLVFRQTRRLPENRTRLYEMFVDLLSGGWDLAKGVQRGSAFGSVVKLMVLRRIAAKTHMNGKRHFGKTDLKYTIRTTLSQKFLDTWEKLENELLQDGLITRLGNDYEFAHLSFQEFLAARDLLGDPTSRRADLILGKFLGGEVWWKEVLCFYAALAGKPNEILEWIADARSRISHSVQAARLCDALEQSIIAGFPSFLEE